MKLPDSQFPLLDYADASEVKQSLILHFIEEGGAEFLNNVFIAYAAEELMKKDFLDGETPVGGLALGRDIMAAVFNNFKKEFDKKNPQDET